MHPRKVALARLLWRGTTVSQVWLAERLAMRSAANVSQQLRRVGTEPIKGKLPKRLALFLERAIDQGQRVVKICTLTPIPITKVEVGWRDQPLQGVRAEAPLAKGFDRGSVEADVVGCLQGLDIRDQTGRRVNDELAAGLTRSRLEQGMPDGAQGGAR